MMAFTLGRLPRIEFGAGCFARLPELAASEGRRLLLVTGSRSFTSTAHWELLQQGLRERGCEWELLRVDGEPSPELVDAAVREHRDRSVDAVIGIGGGSVLDAAKAIAGLLQPGNSVMDHLEGVGPELPYRGPATPFIAVPTTAGTGSEATRNAVLTRHGADGFKKSFRDERLVAAWAVVDPDLLIGCPPDLIAANGMDAFTQLLESFVSTRANPLTDALARSGLRAAMEGLLAWHAGGEGAAAGRERMAYASLLSGMCLAHTGLGSVHGLAQPLGSFFPIAHGVVCGTLLASATRVNLAALREREPDSPALAKYAEVGRMLAGDDRLDADAARAALLASATRVNLAALRELEPHSPALAKYAEVGRMLAGEDRLDAVAARAALLTTLEDWTRQLRLPSLSALGVRHADCERIVAHSRGSSMKTNPIVLTDEEIRQILLPRLDEAA